MQRMDALDYSRYFAAGPWTRTFTASDSPCNNGGRHEKMDPDFRHDGIGSRGRGKIRPHFKGKDLSGKTWTESSKGYLLVDFWASWCAPCIKEIPALNTLYGKYHTLGRLDLLGLSLDEGGKAVVKAAVDRNKIDYPVAMGSAKLAESFGVEGFPTAFLLKDGKIIKVLAGERTLAAFERTWPLI